MTTKFYEPELAPYYDPKEDSKIAVITGGNQGIGFYTILHLYLHGYKVYMLGRTESKCMKAIEEIKAEAKKRTAKYTSEETGRYLGDIDYVKCDLMDLATVEVAGKELVAKLPKIDILINNAGIMSAPFEMTKDKYEQQYQVNVASHVLLTMNVLPLLEKAKSPRLVWVSSLAHTQLRTYEGAEKYPVGKPDLVYRFRRYGITKLDAIHITKMIAKKHPKILAIPLHPGIIITGLYDSTFNSFASFLTPAVKTSFKFIDYFVGVNTEVGAYASLRAALDPSFTAEKSNDTYLTTGGVAATPTKVARNLDYAQETWDWNMKGLRDRGFKIIE